MSPARTHDRNEGRKARVAFGERLRRRDPAALAALYDDQFERVYGYVRRHVADEGTAEDLTHDVFLHVYRAIPSFDPRKAIRPWLFAIAANRLRDHWRSLPRRVEARQTRLDDEGAQEPLQPAEEAGGRLERSELASDLESAIRELPESLGTTLRLRALDGLPFEAIAERVGRNVVAVRKRYSRALGLLREKSGPALSVHLRGA